jgi:Rho guanine nucleotide exchange factor 10
MLLREDDVQRLEFNSSGQVARSKGRRLLLLNDRVVCVTVSGRPSEGEAGLHSSGPAQRLTLKWSAHVNEVEVVEGTSTGTLARMVSQPGGILAGVAKKTSLTKTTSATNASSVDKQMAENLAQDMSDLMHDFDMVSR